MECAGELNEMLKVVVVPYLSGIHEESIYKVPPRIRQSNPEAYTPRIISIGPFHSPHASSSDNILHQMEQLKLKYLKGFLTRTKLSVEDLVFNVQEWENRIRSCYAELLSYNSNDFITIIIIDACFIIELFLRHYERQENDPILLKCGLFNDIGRDLALLENQLPFFFLEDICKIGSINLELPSFLEITMVYFQKFNLQKINSERVQSPKHFTDLLRTFLLLPTSEQGQMEYEIEHVYSVSQLSEAGLVFELSESECLLDLNFDDNGAFKMPRFLVHDGTEMYLRNMLAFEECHISDKDSRYITQYFSVLDFLINTEKDVSILVDKGIIVNLMGDANAVAVMINNLSKDIIPQLNSKYKSVCKRLNEFYENHPMSKYMNKYKAILMLEYFNTPWKIASTVAAVLLLLLTLTQTVCSIISL